MCDMKPSESKGRPATIHHEMVHFKQRFDWDCGISCVLMVLSRSQRQYLLQNFRRICDEEQFGTRYANKEISSVTT